MMKNEKTDNKKEEERMALRKPSVHKGSSTTLMTHNLLTFTTHVPVVPPPLTAMSSLS